MQPLLQGEHLIFNPMTLEPGEDETVASLPAPRQRLAGA